MNEVETSYYYRFNLAKWTLNVTKTGAGTGRVSSTSAINCGPVCSSFFDHATTVALTATPDAGAVFKDLDRRLQRTGSHLHADGHEGDLHERRLRRCCAAYDNTGPDADAEPSHGQAR